MPKKIEEKTVKTKTTKRKTTTSSTKKNVEKTVQTVKKKTKDVKPKKASTTKKVASKNNAKKSNSTSTQALLNNGLKSEYYDLPWGYNKTVVKILAQTPKKLFVYWEISEDDRNTYIKDFGENFFETTYPVLIINNIDINYSFEVAINDFANSWYIDVNDANCNYVVELGRKIKESYSQNFNYDYIYVTHSNVLEIPNNKILLPSNIKTVTFRNTQNNVETYKDVNYSLLKSNENNSLVNFYKSIYSIEENESINNIFDYTNPSS